jgi:hypothetical protein
MSLTLTKLISAAQILHNLQWKKVFQTKLKVHIYFKSGEEGLEKFPKSFKNSRRITNLKDDVSL